MNHPSSSFHFLPQNPKPNLFPPYHHNNHHHHQHPASSSTAATSQRLDLHTTLSTLRHLIHLSETTINCVSNLFPSTSTTCAAATTCPYNSNHRVPSDSLFHHYLQCPASPASIDLALLNSLHYPNSLQSASSLMNQINNRFDQTLPNDAITDLCFSLDDYCTSLDRNFFYSDCPAVVKFPLDDRNADRMLTLPVVLSAECVNFTGNMNDDLSDTVDDLFGSCHLIELLPSEYWNVWTEINNWNEFPDFYSYGVLRSILCLYMRQEKHFMEWILVNSPCYGVVIDKFMKDHIVLLFRLSLKAIAREALGSLDSFSRGESKGDKHHFGCPIMVRVLTWLASQLAVLYGEVNGKLFAINMLKLFLLITLSKSLFFPCEQRASESHGDEVDGKLEPVPGTKRKMEMVFVSQVAATVAALHERSSFEARIKVIRGSCLLPNYQRLAEHVYMSKKAEEERRKRPDYRSIIEHDGVLWQRGCNQETNKKKSREELLAEERDYKRRRMSYRGKKMKRSTTEVMRDIIEEYMEEITQASISGQPPDSATKLASKPFFTHGVFTDNEARIMIPNSSNLNNGGPLGHWKQSVSDVNVKNEHEIQEKSSKKTRQGHHREYHGIYESSYGGEFYSRNADGTSCSHRRGEQAEQRFSRKHDLLGPDRVHCSSHEQVFHQREQVHGNVEQRDSRQRSRYKRSRSSAVVHSEFEDRYVPSKSHDLDDDRLCSES